MRFTILTVLCAFFVCFLMSFVSSSHKKEYHNEEYIQKLCDDFCVKSGCVLFEHRHGVCSCSTPDNHILQGDVIILDLPGKHPYVINMREL